METTNVIPLYSVELNRCFDDTTEKSSSYYTDLADAKRVGTALCKEWLEDPHRYLVTTESNDIRVYDKIMDKLHAVVFIRRHRFVELG